SSAPRSRPPWRPCSWSSAGSGSRRSSRPRSSTRSSRTPTSTTSSAWRPAPSGGWGMADRGAARLTTLPNLLGIARVAATPVVMVLLLADGPGTDLAAALLYLLAALSDIADGWIARRRDQVTPFGVFMDLAADKVLVAGVIIAMVQVGL